MTQPAFPNSQVLAGIGRETGGYGSGATPALWLPWSSLNPDDLNNLLPDIGWRSIPVNSLGHSPGQLEGKIDLGGNVHADTIGFPIAGMLGDVVSAGSNPTTHTIALLTSGAQQPPSYAITTVDQVQPLRRNGAKFNSLTLDSTASGLLTFATSVNSLAASNVSAPAASFTTVPAIAGWRAVVKLGGTTITNVIQTTLNMTRAIVPKRNPDGSQAPYLQRSEALAVSGSLILIMAIDTYRTAFQAGTDTTLDVTYSQGSGATAQQVTYHCTSIVFTDVDNDYQGAQYGQTKIAWSADANTTDIGASGGRSPIKFTLKNQVASGVYAA